MHARNTLLIGALCIACFGAGYVAANIFRTDTSAFSVRANSGEYTFINPLLLCRNNEDHEFAELSQLKEQLNDVTEAASRAGTIKTGSVYVRDLNSARWTGVNENEEYEPASLLKVPLLIAYLNLAQRDSDVLDERVWYARKAGQEPPLVDELLLESNRTYTVLDLLRGMIIDSDNSAKEILEQRIDQEYLRDIYGELGITSPYDDTGTYKISTRAYALFFRVLYNATLLGRTMSERAFEILADVKFDKGLRAGTPEEVAVAHKYGYRILQREPAPEVELSDCGVVYLSEKPYLLCVMARSSDPELASTYIKDIAAVTYDFFSR